MRTPERHVRTRLYFTSVRGLLYHQKLKSAINRNLCVGTRYRVFGDGSYISTVCLWSNVKSIQALPNAPAYFVLAFCGFV